MAEYVNTLSLFLTKKYEETFPNIPVLAEQDYFLQFNAYDVYLPKASIKSLARESSLNVFEQSVLRLLALNHFTVDKLADSLCLKPDLIKFILQKLTDTELIDANHCLTENGSRFIGNTPAEITSDQSVPLIMLVRRDDQRLMPLFFPKESKGQGQIEKPHIKMTVGSVGRGKSIDGRCIFVKESGKRASILPQTQIISAINAFNHKAPPDKKILYDPGINIPSSYDAPIFLHTKAVLQNGYIDQMVASEGYSIHNDFLREYIERQKSDVFQSIKKKAFKSVSKQQEDKKPRGKYAEIKEAMKYKKINVTNPEEEKKAATEERRMVGNLIKAVEWALLYHLRQFPPPPELLRTLCLQTPQENAETILAFAKRLGLKGARASSKMFAQVSSATVKKCMDNENPMLVIHLPVTIATAAKVVDSRIIDALNALNTENYKGEENDKREDAFTFLSRLDRYGKEIRHSDEWHPIEGDKADALYNKVLKFIEALLPDYDNPTLGSNTEGSVSLHKLNAELAVSSELGEEFFSALPENLREQLLKIVSDKWGGQMLPPYEFIGTLSVILEMIFYNLLQELPPIAVKKAEILQRLSQNGISDKLKTVKDVYYDHACERRKSTLGAYALAYMATLSDEELQEFAKCGISDLVYKIAGLRGHGNQLGLVVDMDILLKLRSEVFAAVKFLGGNDR